MPPLVAAFAVWASISVGMAYLVIATVVLSAGMAVYGSAQARRAERQARDDRNASMKDRMVTRIATEAPHRYIYGRAKVGADIVAMFTSGDRDQFKHLVCVHAAHECDAIEEVWVNNALVDGMDSSGDPTAGRFAVNPEFEVYEEVVTGPSFTLQFTPRTDSLWVFAGAGSSMRQVSVSTISGRNVTVGEAGQMIASYERAVPRRFHDPIDDTAPIPGKNPVVRVQKHNGGANDIADAYLSSILGDKWPATAVLRGLCYTVITLDLNHPEFQGGLVPIHAVIRGRKLYDPRTGLKVWSQNPALIIYDYLTSPLCAVPAADLPIAQFIAAANVCDEVIPDLGPRYTINGSVTSDQGQTSVLEAMTQAMAGSLVSTTWDVYAGKYIAPIAALTQEDIVGGLQITPGVSDASIYNGVKGQYISAENKNVQTDFRPYQNSVYRAADGRDLYTNIDFPFTDSLQRVTNLARVFTEDQRNGFTIKAEFSLKAWPMKVGARVTFTSATLGQSAKVYRITDKSYSPNSAVQLTLKEDAASIWDFADAVVVDSTPNSDLPDPWKIDPLTALTCTSGEATLLRQADGSTVPRILTSWPATMQTKGVQVEVEWRPVSSPTWSKVSVDASEKQAYLGPITPGYFYIVRARCYNPYINTRSAWITTVYQVQVFSARPVAYKWATDQPASPNVAGSYAWATGTYSAPAGWSSTPPTAPTGGNVTLWEISPLVTDISASGSTPFNWGVDAIAVGYSPNSVGAGPAGYSNARVFAYQRKSSAPTGTPGAVDYDFTTGTITTATLANGWLKTIPASDGNPLYVTSASASAAGTTDSIGSAEWSGAVVLAYDGGAGTAGLNNATVTLYQRTTSATAPAKPSVTVTYTFATGALSVVNNGWTNYIPSAGGAYLHTTLATAISASATDTIAPTEWAAVQLMYDAAALIAAQAAADAANAKADAMAADGVLDRSEKVDLIMEMEAAAARYTALTAQAAAMGVPFTAYTTARDARDGYLVSLDDAGQPAWNDITQNTNIVRTTYRARVTDYYREEMSLLNAIAAKSATVSSWAGITGPGKPSPSKGSAINDDPALENIENAWTLSTGLTVGYGTVAPGAVGGTYVSADTYLGGNLYLTAKAKHVVDVNATYSLTASLLAAGGNDRNMYIFVNFFDAAGAQLPSTSWGGSMSGYTYGGKPAQNTFTRYGSDFGAGTALTIPEGAKTMSVGVWFQYSSEGGTSSVQQAAQNIRLVDMTAVRAAEAYAITTAAEAAQAKADLAETTAKAYADGIVTAEEARAIADATAKANAAQAAAEAAAAEDATAKANAAATTSTWGGVSGPGKPADNATVGAPAGTNVAGVPAVDVAAGATAINSAFSATLSGNAGGGSYPNGSSGYGYLQVAITGGNAPYSVRWILTETLRTGNAGAMVMTNRTGTYNEFSGSGESATLEYEVTVLVVDSKQRTLTLGQGISVTHGTPV